MRILTHTGQNGKDNTSKLVGFVNLTKSLTFHAFKKLIDKLARVFSIVRYCH